jgi:hypothetical protein
MTRQAPSSPESDGARTLLATTAGALKSQRGVTLALTLDRQGAAVAVHAQAPVEHGAPTGSGLRSRELLLDQQGLSYGGARVAA